MTDADIEGFCKTAEEHGVAPEELVKKAIPGGNAIAYAGYKSLSAMAKALASKAGISPSAVMARYYSGLRGVEQLSQPAARTGRISAYENSVIKRIAALHGIPEGRIRERWISGKRGLDLIRAPGENSVKKVLEAISSKHGIPFSVLHSRWYKRGLRAEDLIRSPAKPSVPDGYKNVADYLSALSTEHRIPMGRLTDRWYSGKRGADLVAAPHRVVTLKPANYGTRSGLAAEIDGLAAGTGLTKATLRRMYSTVTPGQDRMGRFKKMLAQRARMEAQREAISATADVVSNNVGVGSSTLVNRYLHGKRGLDVIAPPGRLGRTDQLAKMRTISNDVNMPVELPK